MTSKLLKITPTLLALAVVVSIGTHTARGNDDSPPGSPPYGINFVEGRAGTQLSGQLSAVFSDIDQVQFARVYDAVVRMRFGNELHIFYDRYDCAVEEPLGDACDLCNAGRMFLGDAGQIQLCIQAGIGQRVVDAFFPGSGMTLNLKDIAEFVSEPDGNPAAPDHWVAGAAITAGVK
jgi:hypothetical protein